MGCKTVAGALLGQLLALIIALTAVCSASLAEQGLSAPTLQSSLNYSLLGLVYTVLHVRQRGWRLKAKWWMYALLALLDVEGNFCLVLAYRYTSLTSATLLDSFTIPMVVLLSMGLLGAMYHRGHYFGAGLCIAGLLMLVGADYSAANSGGGEAASNPVLGDVLVLLRAMLYALCNVLQEWLLGEVLVHELLGMLGLFGCLWSAAQGLPLELHILEGTALGPSALLPFLGFGLSMFTFYSLVPYELKWGGAALLNISLLSSDLWTALARYFYFGGFPGSSLLFFLASLLIVAAGILLFTWSGDVDTRLGANSTSIASSNALPVHYQPVPGAEHRLLPALSSKETQEVVQEVHRQVHRDGPVANPFDVAASRRYGGTPNGGFAPLFEKSWAPSAAGAGQGGNPSSPVAVPVAVPPGTAEIGDTGLRTRSSLEFDSPHSPR